MPISEEDADIICRFFENKMRLIPFLIPKPSVKKFAKEVPQCMKKYTLGEILDLLTENFP